MLCRPAVAALLLGALVATVPATAQPSFVYLNQERMLTGSQRGQALLAEEEAARDALRAEAREIEAAFEAEERDLTEARPEMAPEAFRERANDFDARVVEARSDQDARAAALAQQFDQKRRQFYADVGPILVGLMERIGALAILDEASVLLADQSLNVTDAVIAEIDRIDADATPDGAAGDPAAASE